MYVATLNWPFVSVGAISTAPFNPKRISGGPPDDC
jgi:hypothetical protein